MIHLRPLFGENHQHTFKTPVIEHALDKKQPVTAPERDDQPDPKKTELSSSPERDDQPASANQPVLVNRAEKKEPAPKKKKLVMNQLQQFL